ncbi:MULTISPECIES: flagellar basal body rod protein FlgC [Maridesulfovibrio]|uniref:Flagellar basal-body rod protein FlgC n=1 Tax=Maridesulfovibrio salexigens (strain ATCC 14822 / DSM 2638 / NCIMB 8403 / VKM B-1763) TaxID=526222 RepID=C6C155_MARSD|nr:MULTISPECIES: flagellar basal body rod protein FlgC [Maridesulfovibrio]ACS79218.1 flagellar basal-body rod protein FlgC [Maridesulfovibrio salexigens DSM 2638]
MNFFTALDIGASGLKAQREYLNVVSMNMANAKTTRTAEGGPYRRKSVSMESSPVLSPFETAMNQQLNQQLRGVTVRGIVSDTRPFKEVYEPNHPDADKKGIVRYPDINVVEEMVNMITISRSYEANAQAVDSAKRMFNRALRIGMGQ